MEAQTFLVVEATPNPKNAEDMQKYGAQSYTILAKHGGEPAANYKVQSVMDSGDKPAMIGVFSFPSAEASMRWSMILNIKQSCRIGTEHSPAFDCSFVTVRKKYGAHF